MAVIKKENWEAKWHSEIWPKHSLTWGMELKLTAWMIVSMRIVTTVPLRWVIIIILCMLRYPYSLHLSCHNSNFLQSAAETTNWKAVQDINPCFPHVLNDTIEQAEALTPEIQSKSKFSLHIHCCGHISWLLWYWCLLYEISEGVGCSSHKASHG